MGATKIALFVLIPIMILLPAHASYESSTHISISTSKPVYKYGEKLAFSVKVSNVTGSLAFLEIVDQTNRSSSPVDVIIAKPYSNFTAPVPFYRTTFEPGIYNIRIQYSGGGAETSFRIVDSSNIAIPPEFKVMASSWIQNQTSDSLFGQHIAELVNSGVIGIKDFHEQNVTQIPPWFKDDTTWWSNGLISDEDFGHAIQYLIESNIMKIGQ